MINSSKYKITDWLPTTKDELKLHGWDELDAIIFSGDAYIDHPSFGAAVIGRIIESQGLRVAIVPQPNWRDDLRDFKKLGKPNMFFGVTSGSMDSMVNHYTANLRLRSDDAYTPGGKAGYRPDYATIVYSNILKKLYPDVPVIIGGIEASLRRYTHYDYWSDKLKKSILIDSKADLLVYGMGEKPLLEILKLLKKGVEFSKLKNIPQTAYIEHNTKSVDEIEKWETIELFSHQDCLKNKINYANNFRIIEEESNKMTSSRIIQKTDNDLIVVNPTYPIPTENEIDSYFDLPYTRLPHPKYNKKGDISAYEMIKHSVNIHRGCFGGCSFCSISMHQNKFISSRSEKSILKEIDKIIQMPDFKGYISDIGGPTANMYKMQGIDISVCEKCKKPSCIYPKICNNLNVNHLELLNLYKKIRNISKVKKVTIGSGIRYDLFLKNNPDKNIEKINNQYISELIKYHISGRLKVAPEHTSKEVLKLMRKPDFDSFIDFKKIFDKINKEESLNQEIIPYFISSHPGCTNIDMAELAVITKDLKYKLAQIQDFTPTPMTLATTIYFSGIDPYTLKKIYTPKTQNEKTTQRKYFFWYKPEYKNDIIKDLIKQNRKDLIEKIFGNKISAK